MAHERPSWPGEAEMVAIFDGILLADSDQGLGDGLIWNRMMLD